MKKILFFPLIVVFLAACSGDTDPDNEPYDDSPGVDEYFRMTLDGDLWAVEADSVCAAVLANFGSGPKIIMSATLMSDSTHINYNIPYFYGSDTTLSIPPTQTLVYFGDDGSYTPVSGTFHISRTTVGDLEVYEGTFNIVYEEVFSNNTIQATNGEFRLARIL